jgi:hypothetical protein
MPTSQSATATGILGGLGIAFGMLLSLGSLLQWRRLSAVPRKSCGEALETPIGEAVKVVGRAECDEPLIAPMSKTPCVFYSLDFFELVRSRHGGGGGEEERTLTSSSEWTEWFIEDETGAIPVRYEGADLEVASTASRSNRLTTLDPHPIFREYGLEPTLSTAYRCRERCIPVSSTVFASGRVVNGPALGGGRDLLVSTSPERSLQSVNAVMLAIGLALAGAGGCGVYSAIDSAMQETPTTADLPPGQRPLQPFGAIPRGP